MRPILSIVYPFEENDPQGIDLALACTVALNLHQMQRRRMPPLYQSGVRYRRETCLVSTLPETCERFLTYEQLLRERFGDCDDLSSARCAELICSGEDPRARARVYKTEVGYHAIVVRGDGSIEDPSALLGMPVRRTRT